MTNTARKKESSDKPFSPSSGKKALLRLIIGLAAIAAAMGLILFSDNSARKTTAQKNALPADPAAVSVRPDRLSIALDLRSAADYQIFAGSEIRGQIGDRIKDRSGSLAAGGETERRVQKDLGRSLAAIGQLACENLESDLSGGGSYRPGVYCVPAAAELAGELTLDAAGDQNGVFIFRFAESLSVLPDFRLNLTGGAGAANVFFVSEGPAAIAVGGRLEANLLARGSIEIADRASVKGKVLSVSGDVSIGASSTIGGDTGFIEICKTAVGDDPQDEQFGLGNRVFRFRVGGQVYDVPVGQCSPAIELPAGVVVIEELLDGTFTNRPGTFSGRFRLVEVSSPVEGAVREVNLATRTASVFVRPGDVGDQTIVDFFNTFAITGVIEVCKRSVGPVRVDGILVDDMDVSGFFDFTVDAIPNRVFTALVGSCTGPIQVTVPTTPGPRPQQARVRVTELAESGFTLDSVTAFPASNLVDVVLNQGIVNSVACSTIGFGSPAGCTFSNLGGGYATVDVLEGGAAEQTVVNFFNRSNPGTVKVCKVAGVGVPLNTRFLFEVRGRAPSNPFPGPYLPGTDIVRFVVVQAGPPEGGGFCAIVRDRDGSPTQFITGTNVLITEISVLDPIPEPGGNGLAEPAETVRTKTGVGLTKGEGPGGGTAAGKTTRTASLGAGSTGLNPFITESGQISWSIDGLGTDAASGTITVQKPAGATVRRAFMLAATVPTPGGTNTIANGDITINGNAVSFGTSVTNTVVLSSGMNGIMNNYLGDVTNLVKPTIDSAAAGPVNFTIVENAIKRPNIDGEILVVIFNDPNETTINTIILLFGGQLPTGDMFMVDLNNPVDKSATGFALDFTLGISYSAQRSGFTPLQFSTVDVSTNTIGTPARLTSSAGGQDDGAFENGALMTVGGVGDTNANPAPNAPPDGTRTDDELYSLAPLVNDGDTKINVFTMNPSNNDNIFFAGFFLGNNTLRPGDTITLTPETATNPINTPHTVTATVLDSEDAPVAGREVRFEVVSGPNTGETGTGTTDDNGQATFTYMGGTIGTDTIEACTTDDTDREVCARAIKDWIDIPPFPPDVKVLIRTTCGLAPDGSTVQGITVSPNPNLERRQVIFKARKGVCEAQYTNYLCRPSVLKLCKVAGDGVAVGTEFNFDVVVDGGLVGPSFRTNLSVPAGPAAQGGFCRFVNGPFRVTNDSNGFRTFNRLQDIMITEQPVEGTVATAITSTTGGTADLAGRSITFSADGGFNNAIVEVSFTNAAGDPGGVPPRSPRFDFDGDGRADPSVFRKGDGTWYVLGSDRGFYGVNWGLESDVPVAVDFDGDGRTDYAVVRDGVWHILRSSDNGYTRLEFGQSGDLPVLGDWDGDGIVDVAVYRAGQNGEQGHFYFRGSMSNPENSISFIPIGLAGDIPVPADYDGDGIVDPAVWRPSNGTWYFIESSTRQTRIVQFGIASDMAVPADYDGDGKADISVYRDGVWHLLSSSTGAYTARQFGLASDKPVPADYDGDGKVDMAVYRDGEWHILQSANNQYKGFIFGISTDVPIPKTVIYQ